MLKIPGFQADRPLNLKSAIVLEHQGGMLKAGFNETEILKEERSQWDYPGIESTQSS